MIFKASLLKEYKERKQPLHGCMTQHEHLTHTLLSSVNKHIENRMIQYLEWSKDKEKWLNNAPRTLKIVKVQRLPLPVDEMQDGYITLKDNTNDL